ncbi:MAG: hypothetical protein ACLGIK_14090, partial [Gemmatimonadota bacterium]
ARLGLLLLAAQRVDGVAEAVGVEPLTMRSALGVGSDSALDEHAASVSGRAHASATIRWRAFMT